MTVHIERPRPSDDPEVLTGQLLREVEQLQRAGEDAEEPKLYRAYLRHVESLAWDGVARGDLEIPRRLLDHLRVIQPFADTHRLEVALPLERAALEIHWLIRSLYLASDTLAEKQVEVRLADRCSETEQEILQVLLNSRGEYMRRGDIHAQLAPDSRPTPARVGQILVELLHAGLLQRVHGCAQGNANASFYALSPRGISLCEKLGLILIGPVSQKTDTDMQQPNPSASPTHPATLAYAVATLPYSSDEPIYRAAKTAYPADQVAWLQKLGQEALDLKASETRRGVAVGILANSDEMSFEQIIETLEASVRDRQQDNATMTLLGQVIAQIVLTKSGAIRSDLTFGRCVASLLGRNNPTSPPSSPILSARRQAAVTASERWLSRSQSDSQGQQAVTASI